MVSASDCGSEGRGFESHYPPHKKNRYLSVSVLFILGGYGIRRGRPHRRWGKKVSGGHFFRPGENPWRSGCIQSGCRRVSIFLDGGYGIRKINADVRGTSACHRSRRWQHLNFRQRRKCKRIPYPPLIQITIPQSAPWRRIARKDKRSQPGPLHKGALRENPWAGDGIPEGCWHLPIICHSTLSRVTIPPPFAIIKPKEAIL